MLLLALLVGCGAGLRFERAGVQDYLRGENYYALGLNLRQEGVLAFPANPRLPTAYRAPLFPAFISVLLPDGKAPSPRRVLYAQALLGALAIVATYLLGAAVHSPPAGMLAAALYAFGPEQIRYTASLEVEHFYSVLLLAVACALVYWSRRPSVRSAASLGFLLGLSLNCRSALFLFPLLLLVLPAVPALRSWIPCRSRGHPGLVLLVAAGMLLPWTIRNAVHFRAFVPLERHAATCNLYTASEGLVGTLLPIQAQALAAFGDRTLLQLDENERNRSLVERAWANLWSRPGRYLGSVVKRVVYIAWLYPWHWLMALLGVWLCRRDPRIWPVAILSAYFCGVHALLSVEGRYFVPVSPELQVLSACAMASLGEKALCWSRLLRGGSGAAGDPLASLRRAVAVALWIGAGIYAAAILGLGRELVQGRLAKRADVHATEEGVFPARAGQPEKFFNDRGVQRYLAGDRRGAEADFRMAIQVTPAFVPPYLGLAALERLGGMHARAERACARAVELAAQEAEGGRKEAQMLYVTALECRATELQALGRFREARSIMEASRRTLVEEVARPRMYALPERPALEAGDPARLGKMPKSPKSFLGP